MGRLRGKGWGLFGLVINLVSFVFLIMSLLTVNAPYNGGVGISFAWWAYSVIMALLGMLVYFVDAVFCILKALKKESAVLNILFALMVFGGIPLVLILGGDSGIGSWIWNGYYAVMLVLELVLVIRQWKDNGAKKPAA